MTEIIYLATVLYAFYVIDDVVEDIHVFIVSVFFIVMYLFYMEV